MYPILSNQGNAMAHAPSSQQLKSVAKRNEAVDSATYTYQAARIRPDVCFAPPDSVLNYCISTPWITAYAAQLRTAFRANGTYEVTDAALLSHEGWSGPIEGPGEVVTALGVQRGHTYFRTGEPGLSLAQQLEIARVELAVAREIQRDTYPVVDISLWVVVSLLVVALCCLPFAVMHRRKIKNAARQERREKALEKEDKEVEGAL